MLAVALATEERNSIATAKLSARCGCRVTYTRNAYQQTKRWLAELHRVWLDAWALDRDWAVVFRKAGLGNIRPSW